MLLLRRSFIVVAAAFAALGASADIYVSPSGSDSAAGTLTAPIKSIQSAVNKVTAGSTIYLRGGTYALTTNVQISRVGTSSAPFTMAAYNNEKVVIDGEALPYTPADLDASLPNSNRGNFHIQNAAYWNFYGLELIHGPYGIYCRDCNNNHFKRIITRDNYETGFQLEGSSAHNTVYYLDSYGNHDPRKNGESADGFACKEGVGEGNVLLGARLWNNVDDGLDLWEFKSAVTILDTLSWGNGFNRWNFPNFAGDGNGFKLGGGDAADKAPANHIVTNSIAFANAAGGFVDNSQPGSFQISRNTAWNNGGVGFKFGTATATLTGNVAALNKGGETSLGSGEKASGNSWNGVGGTTWNNASFRSVDPSTAEGARASNGEITCSDFLLPASGAAIGATTC